MENNNPDFEFIDTQAQLSICCKSLACTSVIAIDTEFVRERTYYPIPGLLQISDSHTIYLIDPKACSDLREVFQILEDEKIKIIMHSSSEDIELLYSMGCGEIKGLFDTQIAANWLGMGQSISLQNLVEHTQNVLIEKQLSRTDWLKRPLSEAQLAYAAIDVLYLHQIYQQQVKELEEKTFLQNAEEDSNTRCRNKKPEEQDESAYLKIKKAKTCQGQHLVALQKLSVWREQQARKDDKPRQHVIKDIQLLSIATALPSTIDELAELTEIQPYIVRRYGESMLNIMVSITDGEQVNPAFSFRSISGAGDTLNACRELMVTIHLEDEYPREVLPSKRWLEQFLLHQIAPWYPLPEGWSGWRKSLLEKPINQLINKHQFKLS